jgi:hypothetical protein
MRHGRATVALVAALGSAAAGLWAKPPEAVAQPSLLESPERMIAALRARFGRETRVLNLDLRPEAFDVKVQDPAVPTHVDRFTFEDGAFGEPAPVPVGRSRKRLEAQLFPLAEVDLAILPRLLAEAEQRARTEGGKATHVRIERREGSSDYESWGRPLIRVFVQGPRGGAFVEYGLEGKEKDVKRW